MSNDQVKTKLDVVQVAVKSSVSHLVDVIKKIHELEELIQDFKTSGCDPKIIDKLTGFKGELIEEVDKLVDAISHLISEYQNLIKDTI